MLSGSGSSSDGTSIAATVDFSLSGSIFTVVLTNAGATNQASQASVLTELLFNGTTTITPLPAIGDADRGQFAGAGIGLPIDRHRRCQLAVHSGHRCWHYWD